MDEMTSNVASNQDSSSIACERALPPVSMQELRSGAYKLEEFLLRPARLQNYVASVRLCIVGSISGWRLKEELVESMGLVVGETVAAEVELMLGPGISDDADDIDLFADGIAADWLLRTVFDAGESDGYVIDCRVRFTYCDAPVGPDGKVVKKASLVLLGGLSCTDENPASTSSVSTEDGAETTGEIG